MDENTGRALAEYYQWAGRRFAAALEPISDEHFNDAARERMVHLISVDRGWTARLQGDSKTPFAVPEPLPSRAAVVGAFLAQVGKTSRWFSALDAGGFSQPRRYSSSRGEEFESRAWEVLLYLLEHFAAHRGQVAARLRQLGHDPHWTSELGMVFHFRRQLCPPLPRERGASH